MRTETVSYAISRNGRKLLADSAPEGSSIVGSWRRPLPAAFVHRSWCYSSLPPGRLWTGKVDVVHGTNYVVPRGRHVRSIVTIHDLWFLDQQIPTDPASRTTARLIAKLAACDRVGFHAVSNDVADQIESRFSVPRHRISVIYHGVPSVAEPFGEERQVAEKLLKDATDGAPYFLVMASVRSRKNLSAAVRAFDRIADSVDDLRLVLLGNEPEPAAKEELELTLAASSHRSQIHCTNGWIEHASKGFFLRHALALLVPSHYEGFGLPILEAQSVGVPVIASNVGGISEVCGDSAVLVPVESEGSLAEAMEGVALDPRLRGELKRSGEQNITRFSWDKCAEEMLRFYQE